MKVSNRGANIPWNMRKLVMIAKVLLRLPEIIYFDEKAFDLGTHSPWDDMFEKLESMFFDSVMVGIVDSIDHLGHFDHLIYMNDGKVIEQGRMKDLIRNPDSIISRRIAGENLTKYKQIKR